MLVNFNDPIETAAWSVPVPFHFRPRASFRSLSGRLAALRFRVLENADVSDSRFARLEPVCRLLSIEPASLVAITPRKIKIMFSRERRKNAARNGAARHPRLSSHGPIFISPSPSVRGRGGELIDVFAHDQIFFIFVRRKKKKKKEEERWSRRGRSRRVVFALRRLIYDGVRPQKIRFKSLQGAAGIYRGAASRVLLTKLKPLGDTTKGNAYLTRARGRAEDSTRKRKTVRTFR